MRVFPIWRPLWCSMCEAARLELSGGHGTIETAGLAPGVYLVRAGEQMARITLLK